jgi:hypothetical protein
MLILKALLTTINLAPYVISILIITSREYKTWMPTERTNLSMDHSQSSLQMVQQPPSMYLPKSESQHWSCWCGCFSQPTYCLVFPISCQGRWSSSHRSCHLSPLDSSAVQTKLGYKMNMSIIIDREHELRYVVLTVYPLEIRAVSNSNSITLLASVLSGSFLQVAYK